MKTKTEIENELNKVRETLLKQDKLLIKMHNEDVNDIISDALLKHITSLESAITVLKWVLKHK